MANENIAILAKDYGVKPKEIIELLKNEGFTDINHHANVPNDDMLAAIIEKFGDTNPGSKSKSTDGVSKKPEAKSGKRYVKYYSKTPNLFIDRPRFTKDEKFSIPAKPIKFDVQGYLTTGDTVIMQAIEDHYRFKNGAILKVGDGNIPTEEEIKLVKMNVARQTGVAYTDGAAHSKSDSQ